MNPRSPVVALSAREGAQVRAMMRTVGVSAACRVLGNLDSETLYKAGCEVPIHRMTAEVIRSSLDRI